MKHYNQESPLADTSDIYLARAEACAREARESTLDNVRDRCLRAEQAWRAMAGRDARMRAVRERQAEHKAMQAII